MSVYVGLGTRAYWIQVAPGGVKHHRKGWREARSPSAVSLRSGMARPPFPGSRPWRVRCGCQAPESSPCLSGSLGGPRVILQQGVGGIHGGVMWGSEVGWHPGPGTCGWRMRERGRPGRPEPKRCSGWRGNSNVWSSVGRRWGVMTVERSGVTQSDDAASWFVLLGVLDQAGRQRNRGLQHVQVADVACQGCLSPMPQGARANESTAGQGGDVLAVLR